MPELDLHKIPKWFDVAQNAGIAYGDQSIEDNSPSCDPFTGAWILFPQQFPPLAHYRITAAVNQEEQEAPISDWPENEDPFTQADLLDSEDDQVQDLIFRIRKS